MDEGPFPPMIGSTPLCPVAVLCASDPAAQFFELPYGVPGPALPVVAMELVVPFGPPTVETDLMSIPVGSTHGLELCGEQVNNLIRGMSPDVVVIDEDCPGMLGP